MRLNYSKAYDYIHSFGDPYTAALARDASAGQVWGIDVLRRILGQLDHPQQAYPIFHVAGTKGKGSTSAMLASILTASGHKTGLYTSPHLLDWRERIRIDGRCISEEEVTHITDAFEQALGRPDGVTSFEVTTALAFWHFARSGCQAAVLETGLGGRLDATNVVEPLVSVITHISYDHMRFLGDTLEQIAAEKAGIIKPGRPVVVAQQAAEVLAVIRTVAEGQASPLIDVGTDWSAEVEAATLDGTGVRIGPAGEQPNPYFINLPGHFQVSNAAAALAACRAAEASGVEIGLKAAQDGLRQVMWPGRLQLLARQPNVICDGAHNVESLQALFATLAVLIPAGKWIIIFGCMADKPTEGMLRVVASRAERCIFTDLDNQRGLPAQELLTLAHNLPLEAGHSPAFEAAPAFEDAFQRATAVTGPQDTIVITGSLALVGLALRRFDKTLC